MRLEFLFNPGLLLTVEYTINHTKVKFLGRHGREHPRSGNPMLRLPKIDEKLKRQYN